jgi:hypothetical protein
VTDSQEPSGDQPSDSPTTQVEHRTEEEHFKPNGTVFILILFVATLILLWLSVYVILLSRGVTV